MKEYSRGTTKLPPWLTNGTWQEQTGCIQNEGKIIRFELKPCMKSSCIETDTTQLTAYVTPEGRLFIVERFHYSEGNYPIHETRASFREPENNQYVYRLNDNNVQLVFSLGPTHQTGAYITTNVPTNYNELSSLFNDLYDQVKDKAYTEPDTF